MEKRKNVTAILERRPDAAKTGAINDDLILFGILLKFNVQMEKIGIVYANSQIDSAKAYSHYCIGIFEVGQSSTYPILYAQQLATFPYNVFFLDASDLSEISQAGIA